MITTHTHTDGHVSAITTLAIHQALPSRERSLLVNETKWNASSIASLLLHALQHSSEQTILLQKNLRDSSFAASSSTSARSYDMIYPPPSLTRKDWHWGQLKFQVQSSFAWWYGMKLHKYLLRLFEDEDFPTTDACLIISASNRAGPLQLKVE